MLKNAFYFILKAPFVVKIFKFFELHTGTGTDQNFIIGCWYFLKKRRLYQTTGTNQQFFYFFITL